MTDSERAFARRAVRRKRLFLTLSMASLVVAAGLAILYSIFWWRDHSYSVGPRAVIVLLILLNARQNLRQYRYAGVLEHLLPHDPPRDDASRPRVSRLDSGTAPTGRLLESAGG